MTANLNKSFVHIGGMKMTRMICLNFITWQINKLLSQIEHQMEIKLHQLPIKLIYLISIAASTPTNSSWMQTTIAASKDSDCLVSMIANGEQCNLNPKIKKNFTEKLFQFLCTESGRLFLVCLYI